MSLASRRSLGTKGGVDSSTASWRSESACVSESAAVLYILCKLDGQGGCARGGGAINVSEEAPGVAMVFVASVVTRMLKGSDHACCTQADQLPRRRVLHTLTIEAKGDRNDRY